MDELLIQTVVGAVVGLLGSALVELHHQKKGRGTSILIGLLAILFWLMAVADVTVLGLRLVILAIQAIPLLQEPAWTIPRGVLQLAAFLGSFWGSLILLQVAKNAGRRLAGKPPLPIVWVRRNAFRPPYKRREQR
jgi:hypothetical protein